MMVYKDVEGQEETLEFKVSGIKSTGNKPVSLNQIGSYLIAISILFFILSIAGTLFRSWGLLYSFSIQTAGILFLIAGYAIRNKTIRPKANGKTSLLINTIIEVITSKFVEREIKELPVYDTGKYGEIVNLAAPQDFDMVEQTWVSRPFTLVTILNNRLTNRKMYVTSEPALSDFEKALLHRVYDSLKVFLLEHEIDFNKMDKELILYNNFIRILDVYGIDLPPVSLHKIWYYMKRDYVGYGKLDVLLKDPMIEDISCDGADIPIFLYHRKYTNIETNIVFEEDELNMMILKLAQVSGKSISTGYPIMNARLPDGSRLEATLGREVTTRGGTITIRKFRRDPFTPVDLIKYGTFNADTMAYLWLAVENNKNIIIVGETASGKTTTLNAISLFIPAESKIITIEDTRELSLTHNNWIPATIRETYMGQEAANIDMFELLRSALRQRPEYVIVGEIRGKEAYTLFQAMSTGHTTFSTMHAGSIQTAVNRLLSEPINVPLMMLSALDIMIIQVPRILGRRKVRRVDTLSEFVGIHAATGDISTREVYRWNPLHDMIEQNGVSNVIEEIMTSRGWSKEQINKELEDRKTVLQYMLDRDIYNYRDVSEIIKQYADSSEEVMNLIRKGRTLLSDQHEPQ
jgi:flagellar protein FlaI